MTHTSPVTLPGSQQVSRARPGFPFTDSAEQWALGDLLRRRFLRLPRERRQQMMSHAAFTDALVEALGEVTGRTVHAVHGGGGGLAGRPEDRAAAFLLDHDQYAYTMYGDFSEQHWLRLDADLDNPHPSQRRSTYLHSVIRATKPGGCEASHLLEAVNDAEGLRIQRIDGRYALALHWQARTEEGFSPEAVRMMLGLTLSPATLSHVRFPADGPPVVVP